MSEGEARVLPPAPEAKIQLDRVRTLRCDFQALRLIKMETGVSLLTGQTIPMDEETLPVLLWAFLVHEDPDLTVTKAAGLVSFSGLLEIVTLITDLIKESLPTAEETEGGESEDPLGQKPDAA